MIEEETIVDWDRGEYNPVVKVQMKLRGNYQTSNIVFASGEPASFTMKLGELSYIELPIDDSSWDQAIQDGTDLDGGSDSEDTPGFTLVVASAAIAMAVFVNARRDEE